MVFTWDNIVMINSYNLNVDGLGERVDHNVCFWCPDSILGALLVSVICICLGVLRHILLVDWNRKGLPSNPYRLPYTSSK